MSVEIARNALSRDRNVTIATEYRSPLLALRTQESQLRAAFNGTGETPVSGKLAIVLNHALVRIGVRADFETGTLSMVTQMRNSTGDFRDMPPRGDNFLYWNHAFQGCAPTGETLADFLAEAAEQLDALETTVRGHRANVRPLILH